MEAINDILAEFVLYARELYATISASLIKPIGEKMIRHTLGCLVLLASGSAYGMQVMHEKVSLPSKDILEQRIDGLMLPPQFDECTQLSHNLTNNTEFVGDVLAHVTLALVTYNQTIEQTSIAPNDKAKMIAFVSNQKMVIVDAVLRD